MAISTPSQCLRSSTSTTPAGRSVEKEYDTPNHYYQRYQRGEMEKKDTFSKRVLTTEPKFVQKRRRQKLKEKENQGAEGVPEAVSTSENEKEEKMSLVSTFEKEES